MDDRSIECPACETLLSDRADPAGLARCPYCRHRFHPRGNPLRRTVPTGPPIEDFPRPRMLAFRARLVRPTCGGAPSIAVLPLPLRGLAASPSRRVRPARRGLRPLPALAATAAVAAAVGALALILVGGALHFKNAAAEAGTIEKPQAPSPSPAWARPPTPPEDLRADGERPQDVVTRDDDSRLAGRLSDAEYLSLWSRVQPWLVELTVHTPSGPQLVAGLIVDSRGWVATSRSGLLNALRIEVRTAAAAFESGEPYGPTSDEVRGLLAEDAASDLALVAINRRLVTGFSDPKFATSLEVAGGDPCVAGSPPPQGMRRWLCDCPLARSGTAEQLGGAVGEAIAARGGDENRDAATWLLHGGALDRIAPGSPIFKADGRLAGIAVGLRLDGQGLAASSDALAELLLHVRSPARPFPIDPAAIERAEDLAAAAEGGAAESPEIAQLAETLARISDFQLFTESADEYAQVAACADLLVEIDRRAREPSPEAPAPSPERLERLLDRLEAALDLGLTHRTRSIAAFNRLAAEELKKPSRGFVAVATVVRVGVESPLVDGQSSAVFRLNETELHALSAVTNDHDVLRPGSQWLVIGQAPAESRFSQLPGDPDPLTARHVRVLYVIALNAESAAR